MALNASGQSIIDAQTAKRLGAGYAAMINFAGNPEIATARYYIDDSDDSEPNLYVTRYGGEHYFDATNRAWSPFVQINAPYLTFEDSAMVDTNSSVVAEWSAYGVALTLGIGMPVTTNLTISPAIALGHMHIRNSADYSAGAAPLQPLLDGIFLNWSSDAWLVGAQLGSDYERNWGARSLRIRALASHNLIETYRTNRGSVEFSSYATTFNLHGEVTHPTYMRFKGCPLAVVTLLGGTSFAGPYRDELGFAYFIDGGLALEVDTAQRDWLISQLRLGFKGIYGDDVIGYSAIFSWKF